MAQEKLHELHVAESGGAVDRLFFDNVVAVFATFRPGTVAVVQEELYDFYVAFHGRDEDRLVSVNVFPRRVGAGF